MKDYIVISYYTRNTIYANNAARLIESLLKYSIPNDIVGVEDFGSWYANTNYKPTFLRDMAHKYKNKAIVYVDCDAEFKAYPHLFDIYKLDDSIEVAIYEFDRAVNYGSQQSGIEVLSGTVYLRNCPRRFELLMEWETECKLNPKTWDQKSLQKVLAGKYSKLPGEYCKIFDRMKFIEHPIIVHHQASRQIRNKHESLRTL